MRNGEGEGKDDEGEGGNEFSVPSYASNADTRFYWNRIKGYQESTQQAMT